MDGAISTTSPPRAMMLPSTVSAPVWLPSSLPANRKRPAKASASFMPTAEAVKPAVSISAPAPTAMPLWLTRTTRPLLDSVPNSCEGVWVTTRLIDRLAALGWLIWVVAPAPMEKLFQLVAECAVPAPLEVVTVSLPAWL